MKPTTKYLTSVLLVLCITILLTLGINTSNDHIPKRKVYAKFEKRAQMKKARWQYFNRMLTDPKTGSVPRGIRNKELMMAMRMSKDKSSLRTSAFEYDWRNAGPVDVGGRTRALAIDQRDNKIVLAGGVSGGVWKSVDQGKTWALRSDPKTNHSVTSIVQDPNDQNEWYYSMGEFNGSSESATGALFQGSGVFKSIDTGETWKLMTYKKQSIDDIWESTDGHINDPTQFTSPFDFISKIVISPTTGSIFIASNFFGIYRSTNKGLSFESVLKSSGNNAFDFDVVVDGSGLISASVSGLKSESSGLYVSNNDGTSWSNFTPTSFPDATERSVLAFAPSNQLLIYMLTNTGNFVNEREDVRLYRTDLSDSSFTDLSQNLPQFGGASGDFNTQFNYNMALSIKPDNENIILVGGINLYRSTDGFNTPIDDENTQWIGGLLDTETFYNYPNHHADQHALVWDPTDPDILWSGNDGGVYKTDITGQTVVWENLNYGYRVTQYYTAELPDLDGDFSLLGGTQDNGSPLFMYDFEKDSASSSIDLTAGDGAYSYIGTSFIYGSFQEGNIYRFDKNGTFNEIVTPENDTLGTLFIHPYAVEPVLEEIMYYPSNNHLFVNNKIKEINVQNFWTVKADVVGSEYSITALSASTNPQGILYLAAYDDNGVPKLLKYTQSTDEFEDISIQGAPSGAYPHHIAVNAEDANEFIVVFTNYNINGTYHTMDGGTNYTSIEGNLLGNSNNPGPSIRAAVILNRNESKQYYLGTSTGIYLTDLLNGNSTNWIQDAEDEVGFSVVSALAWREIDDVILAATHGRGMFVGIPSGFFVLKAPKATMAMEVTDSSFVANWDATEHAEDYRLKISSDPEIANLIDGVPEDGLVAVESSVSIYNLPNNQKFYYAAQGANKDRRSPLSNVIEVETLFSTPVAIEATEVFGSEFTANWIGVDGVEFYVLDVATDSLFENIPSGFNDLTVNGTSKKVEGVEELTKYFYRLKAVKQSRNNDSKYSNTISLSTPEITSLEEIGNYVEVAIYPVPSEHGVSLSSSKGVIKGLRITNITGKEILNARPKTKDVHLDISNWKSGVYVATIEFSNSMITKRFMVR